MDITLTKDQEVALCKMKQWYTNNISQVFSLAGCAGSGKSTLISYLCEELNLDSQNVVFCSLTGKATQVLAKKGVHACTIHHLIYEIDQSSQKLKFVKKERLDFPYRLIIIDEFSMVNKKIHEDLLSFGVKIIVVGDPFQLPPIGEDVGLLSNPDAILLEIVRQAQDSPIIKLATHIRQGGKLTEGTIGSGVVITSQEIPDKVYFQADQVLVGKNSTRDELNKRMRQLKGFNDKFPCTGDKLLCIKNNWDCYIDGIPLINGALGYAKMFRLRADNTGLLQFRPDYTTESKILTIDVLPFLGKKPDPRGFKDVFDYGYAITVHKSQGSEYNNVLLIDDWPMMKDYNRWLYTAITRAKKKIIIKKRSGR